VQSSANALLFDLITGRAVDLGGQEVRLSPGHIPQPSVVGDCVVWTFEKPVRVSTPGPDARINEIRQYRDCVSFEVWPWADVRIEFE
jgi:hypothetical protein